MAQISESKKTMKPTKGIPDDDELKISDQPISKSPVSVSASSTVLSASCSSLMNQNYIQIEGWLSKRSRVLRKFRKRWVVLSGNKIFTYKNEKEYNSEPTEIINIENIISIKATSSNKQSYSFDIELEKLTFTLATPTASLRDSWIAEIHKLMNINRTMMITTDSSGNILSFGCKHFRRNCSYLCSCCNKYYFCSYCHDDNESGFINGGHELERHNIIAMKCCKCGKEQKPNNICSNKNCNLKMSHYFCKICKFWDNDPNHLLYHCHKCGVCRSGNKNQYIHCEKCGVCLDKTFYKNHKCMERSTQCDCPICGDYLHMSDQPVTFWPLCGHAIHVLCMEEYLVYDTLCPICREPWMP